ncbi:MAG: hypothetical protein Q8S11_02430 [Daejeonella sp.]|uniref:hypothetical protein n=1 Tax=Daejeonella sp. TaxID=2805397 RepID=UPI002736D433|nr:hypothetical protein [Daejeonella sp.]MDP3467161.1 hypothetical protein [Daejeonella sp.]
MYQFEIRKDCIKEVRISILKKVILGSLIILGFLSYKYFKDPNIYVLLLATTTMVGAIIWGYYKAVERQMLLYDSYVLTIDSQTIKREQYDTPDIIIKTADISRIIKNRDGSFSIKGNSPATTLEVPSQLEEYERFENVLSGIKPISKKTGIQFEDLVIILFLGSFVTVLISNDKIIIAACAAIVVIGWSYSVFKNQQNQNIDSKSKSNWWIGIIFIIYFIKSVYEKLSGL